MSTLPHHFTLALRPTSGEGGRFQPTGFPNLGAALFDRPVGQNEWQAALHVESPQSMANRLEMTTWDGPTNQQRMELGATPYVEIVDGNGQFLTSSRLEAHRLACAYIMDSTIDGTSGRQWLQDRLHIERGHAVDYRELAAAIFDLDPLSLIHGVFFAQKAWPWQPKIARALTCFIDADDVRVATSGGVKKDSVDISGGATESGYGMVPFQRVEYTARSISAFVSIDHEQLQSYGLGQERTDLLEAIVLYELAELFDRDSIRLRTACDLCLLEDDSANPLPSVQEAVDNLGEALGRLDGQLGQISTLQWAERAAKKGA